MIAGQRREPVGTSATGSRCDGIGVGRGTGAGAKGTMADEQDSATPAREHHAPEEPNVERQERAAQFARRTLLQAGWTVPVIAAVGLPERAYAGSAIGHVDNPHADTPHGDTVHSDVHGDAVHSDTHADTLHTDISYSDRPHSDTLGYTLHSDVSHSDTPHSDTRHLDFAAYHEDFHGDVNQLGYNDVHFDASTPHLDIAHTDSPHTDSAHADAVHTDGYIDVVHADSHGDAVHSDSHSDAAHSDSHSDAAHVDIP